MSARLTPSLRFRADNYVKMSSISAPAHGSASITTSPNTPPAYHFTPKASPAVASAPREWPRHARSFVTRYQARFYAANLLSELDAPGEYDGSTLALIPLHHS
jgi:hypothetical protein